MTQVGVMQLVSGNLVQDNLKTVLFYLKKAQAAGLSLVVLPENFAFMSTREKDKWKVAENYGQGPIQDQLSVWAKEFNLWIVAGSILLKGEEKLRSSCLVFNHEGNCVARYDKIHLFDVQISESETHQESLCIERGNNIVTVDSPIGCIGLSICYDLRFPELYQKLAKKGAEIFIIPSAFTYTTGKAHWEILLRARAIENLCFVLASNQGGVHASGRKTYGHSMIIDPWGEKRAEIDTDPGLAWADIDLAYRENIRKQFPCDQHHVLP